MEAWQPGLLIQDDADIAYQPTDKKGKQVAALVKLELTLIMWRAKVIPRAPVRDNGLTHMNCRCVMKPIKPDA